MTIRDAKRPLAGHFGGFLGDPEIVRGNYTCAEFDRFVYFGREIGRIDMGGEPVVSVNLNGGRSGVRTFNDPEKLIALADEIRQAASWLAQQRATRLHEKLVRQQQEEGGQ